ncbi:TPR-like protein [Imleria badia]|nr:TPR-like protein [Imleria badia]
MTQSPDLVESESHSPQSLDDIAELKLPLVHVSSPAFKLWICDELADTTALLTDKILRASKDSHHALANRALIHAHWGDYRAAIDDAKNSIKIQPSAVGYIALAIARIHNCEREGGFRALDFAFKQCYLSPSDIDFLLLIKSKMYFLRGIAWMEQGHFENAIQWFERAQVPIQSYMSPHLEAITLMFRWNFDGLCIVVQQRLCEALYAVGRTREAAEALLKLTSTFDEEIRTSMEHSEWITDFRMRCVARFENAGDTALRSGDYEEAINQYSVALSLDPTAHDLFLKRSKARALMALWEDALRDASKAVELDPSSPLGYTQKRAVLHGAGYYAEAIDTYKSMLLMFEQFPHPYIRECLCQYIHPSVTEGEIRRIVKQTIEGTLRMLIDTSSGLLCDKDRRATVFDALPIFKELVSSMTTQLDLTWIEQAVKNHCRYVMLSHKWEVNEPLFEMVENLSIYDLEVSPENDKLGRFCSLVRDAGFHWAWSDTCCINKHDPMILQQSLVAMFTWYRNSSLTIVFLRGVGKFAKPGDLQRSIWNTRAWTFQEYLASKVIQFYTEDWTPYLNLDVFNHEDVPEIVSEMEQESWARMHGLRTLQSGYDNIREKLYLASTAKRPL